MDVLYSEVPLFTLFQWSFVFNLNVDILILCVLMQESSCGHQFSQECFRKQPHYGKHELLLCTLTYAFLASQLHVQCKLCNYL